MLLGNKFLNLCNHLNHVRGSGATNHDLEITPRQVTVHVDFSVNWLTLLFEQIICKRTKKDPVHFNTKSITTGKRLYSIMCKLCRNQSITRNCSVRRLAAGLFSSDLTNDHPRSERKRVLSMEEKVLRHFVSASAMSCPNPFSSG